MSQPAPLSRKSTVSGFQERRLGGTVIRTSRALVNIDDLVPNERQPRLGPKEDEELQRQIEANEGLFEPLLVEPHPDLPGKYRIIDGDRRWTNCVVLVQAGKTAYGHLPVEITDRTLSDEERLRAWIYIHRQRKEWDAREKEMVAYRLVELVGRASAANILGIKVRELDKLVQIFELSVRFDNLREPGAAITWARELTGVSKKLITPTVLDAVVEKARQQKITNSKDLRKLRSILRDPVAKEHFLSDAGSIDSAMLRIVAPPSPPATGLAKQLESTVTAIKQLPWTQLDELKSDQDLISTIAEAESLLRSLRKNLTGPK